MIGDSQFKPHSITRSVSLPDARVTDLESRCAAKQDGARRAKLAVLCLAAGTVVLAAWVIPFGVGFLFGAPPLLIAAVIWVVRSAAARTAESHLKAYEAAKS